MNKGTGSGFKAGAYTFTAQPQAQTIRRFSVAISGPGSTVETDTTFDLPAKAIVQNAFVVVNTAASSAATFSAGLLSSSSGGSATGFLNAVLADTTGVKLGQATASTSGSPDVFWGANTIGSFLSTFNVGTTAASDFGLFAPKLFASDSVTAKSVTWTLNSTATAFRANLVIEYVDLT